MRILKVSQSYPPFLEKGGPAVKVPAIAERLAGRGHAVTVLTSAHDTTHAGKTQQRNGVEVIYLGAILAYRATTVNAGLLRFCRERAREFDVVHIYGLYDLLGPPVARSCRRAGVPYVLEPMGMYRPIVRSFQMKRLYHKLLGSGMVRGARRVIATSPQEERELVEEGLSADRITVRRNGIELEDFRNLPPRGAFRRTIGLDERTPLVLFLGRLSKKKGLDLLVEAFAGSPSNAHLAIVGPDDRDGALAEARRLVAELHLDSRVTFRGPRFGAEKLQALVDADVFVLPSRNENFGNAVAEAIACGTPVLLTDRCGIAPIVAGRAGLVVPCSAQEIGQGLLRLLADSSLREQFRSGCHAVARELDWDAPVTQMVQIYQVLQQEAAGG